MNNDGLAKIDARARKQYEYVKAVARMAFEPQRKF